MSGYIKLHRSMLDWKWSSDPSVWTVFIHLLLRARWHNGGVGETALFAGQCLTSYPLLTRDTGLSNKAVRTAVKKLESTGEITRVAHNKFSIVTIVNWEKYQSTEDSKGQADWQAKGRQRAGKGQHTKKDKKEKNDKNIHEPRRFMEIFNAKLGLCETYVPHIHDPKIKPLLDAFPLNQIITTIDHYNTKRQEIGSFSSKIYNSNDILKNFPQLHAEAMKLKEDMDDLKDAGIFDDED